MEPNVDFASVYGELREMAHRFFRGQPDAQTLQPTALVHEVYIRLVLSGARANDRAHLASLCARAMRQVLVDHARSRAARRRRERDHAESRPEIGAHASPEDVIAIDRALDEYRGLDERRARLVELRVFGGFPLEQCAELLGVARSTASEDWRVARAWMTQAIA